MSLFQKRRAQSGFTMIEILVVLVLFGLLAVGILASAPSYFSKRRDNQRKADLHNMKIAFEDYASDESCYPSEVMVNTCGSTDINPYMKKMPCDPGTEQPYEYILSSDCQTFQLYTTLENTSDSSITAIGCESGCGPGGAFNYGVVGGGVVLDR